MRYSGNKTVKVAGQAEPLGPTGISGRICIQAFRNNTGYIAIGSEPNVMINKDELDRTTGPVASGTSTAKGFVLQAFEAYVTIGVLNSVWIDASVALEGVSYTVD